MKKFLIQIAPVLWAFTPVAMAQETGLCDTAAIEAAEKWQVPQRVMLAISRVETGRGQDKLPWPWTVNLAGQGHWFDSADMAIAFANDALAAGQDSLDIGCFQLNLRWHSAAFETLADMFDPRLNADYAAQFLTALYDRKGNWVDAVAAYHSSTPDHATSYVEAVETVLRDLPEAPVSAETVSTRVNRFPLLQPGRLAGAGSLMPQGLGGQPFFVAVP